MGTAAFTPSPQAPEKLTPTPAVNLDMREGWVLLRGPHERMMMMNLRVECRKREGWVLLKIPRGDIDGVYEVK